MRLRKASRSHVPFVGAGEPVSGGSGPRAIADRSAGCDGQ